MRPRNPRWLVLVGLYLLFGLLGAWYLSGTTILGNDLATYQRAGDALWTSGDPYSVGAGLGEEWQYRYPPLLAMLMPILGWPPLWFSITFIATLVPIVVAYRQNGAAGLLVPALLVGAWGQQLLNGNSQAIVIALLVLVPRFRTGGPMLLALATMLKLHPALALAWFMGRREWRAVALFVVACVVLLLVQAPWLGRFIDFYLNNPAATATIPGMSLRALGTPIWIGGVVAVGLVAIWLARSRYGWFLTAVLQLVALPRVLLVNLALLLAAPYPPRPVMETSPGRPRMRQATPE